MSKLDTVNGMSIKEWLLANTSLMKIDWLSELKGAGAAGVDRLVLINAEGDLQPTIVFEELEWQAMQYRDLSVKSPAYMKFGGVKVAYPIAHSFFDIAHA